MLVNKKIHFEISERKILLRIFDALFVMFFMNIVSLFFNIEYFNFSIQNFNYLLILIVYLNIFSSVFELFDLQIAANQLKSIKSIVFTTFASATTFFLTPFYTPSLPSSRFEILMFYGTIFVALLCWRLIYIEFLVSHRFTKKVVLICDKNQVKDLVQGLESADDHYKIVGFVNTDSNQNDHSATDFIKNISKDEFEDFVISENVTEIVVASQKTDGITTNLYNHLIHLLESGFVIREYRKVYEEITHRIPLQFVTNDFYKYFPFSRSNSNQLYLLLIRSFDVLFAIIGLAFLCIMIPIIYLVNNFVNKGDLFYFQERVGKNGEVFNIYKLRSMVKNAEENGAVFATTNDMRVTPFGKVLRKSRLDEIPQFLNVLKGEMSLIGPRPERPVFVYEIAERMPYYQIRHVVKPGLTGWAQVSYPYGASIEDSLMKLQYDLYYIKHRSLFLDIKIVLKTLSTILFYRGQ